MNWDCMMLANSAMESPLRRSAECRTRQGRGLRPHLRSAFRNRESVNGDFLLLLVVRERETLHQKFAHHRAHLFRARKTGPVRFSHNVELLGPGPTGKVDKLFQVSRERVPGKIGQVVFCVWKTALFPSR